MEKNEIIILNENDLKSGLNLNLNSDFVFKCCSTLVHLFESDYSSKIVKHVENVPKFEFESKIKDLKSEFEKFQLKYFEIYSCGKGQRITIL